MTEQEALERARAFFLTGGYGCAETTCRVLQEAYGLENAGEVSAAMALNGGVAWSGGVCGALSGAALAVGRLAAQRLPDRRAAKQAAREIVARHLEAFRNMHGAVDCRDLIQQDIHTETLHAAFIESGLWRERCLSQIEFTIRRLFALSISEELRP
jgi:C_GCAxxG_C_C family probable redox protein